MTCKKGEAPATSANVTSAPNSLTQDNSSIAGGKSKAFYINLLDTLFSEVRSKLAQAQVVLNDQGNDFFSSSPTEQNANIFIYERERASIRNVIALGQVGAALGAVDTLLADLEIKHAGGYAE